ncbi:hypothetical protein LT330_005443 [Penicillium expansum]|nr:hypothetical protein LT330_005443 [Penicillium expansum]
MASNRILDLVKTQCRIFSLNFNPQRLRLGNKVLRQRLRGPALAAWYPKQTVSFQDLQNTYKPLGLTTFDEAEDDREEAIQIAKLRGKGRPKKKRTAADLNRIEVRKEEEIDCLPKLLGFAELNIALLTSTPAHILHPDSLPMIWLG